MEENNKEKNVDKSRDAIDYNGIKDSLCMVSNAVSQIVNYEVLINIGNTFKDIGGKFQEVSSYMNSIRDAFSTLAQVIREAKENPNSYINFYDYQQKLDDFHWAWPYHITAEELRELLEKAINEEQFDRLVASFFTKSRLEDMFKYIYENLPKRHKVIWKQIEISFFDNRYALLNNAAISILDNMLSELMKNKGCVSRKGIIHPIIECYADNYEFHNIDFIFELQMLSNNIDLLFEDCNFNEKIVVESNKKIRRHLTEHGFMYSNSKIDSIMILNTIAALLMNQKYLKPFKGTLGCSKKKCTIISRQYVIKNRIQRNLKIIDLKSQ